jgi:hypothetical protein
MRPDQALIVVLAIYLILLIAGLAAVALTVLRVW